MITVSNNNITGEIDNNHVIIIRNTKRLIFSPTVCLCATCYFECPLNQLRKVLRRGMFHHKGTKERKGT